MSAPPSAPPPARQVRPAAAPRPFTAAAAPQPFTAAPRPAPPAARFFAAPAPRPVVRAAGAVRAAPPGIQSAPTAAVKMAPAPVPAPAPAVVKTTPIPVPAAPAAIKTAPWPVPPPPAVKTVPAPVPAASAASLPPVPAPAVPVPNTPCAPPPLAPAAGAPEGRPHVVVTATPQKHAPPNAFAPQPPPPLALPAPAAVPRPPSHVVSAAAARRQTLPAACSPQPRPAAPAACSPRPEELPSGFAARPARQSPRVCRRCGTTDTRMWTTGPDGFQTLCALCGVAYQRRRIVVYEDPVTGLVSVVRGPRSRPCAVVNFHSRYISYCGRPAHRDLSSPVVVPLPPGEPVILPLPEVPVETHAQGGFSPGSGGGGVVQIMPPGPASPPNTSSAVRSAAVPHAGEGGNEDDHQSSFTPSASQNGVAAVSAAPVTVQPSYAGHSKDAYRPSALQRLPPSRCTVPQTSPPLRSPVLNALHVPAGRLSGEASDKNVAETSQHAHAASAVIGSKDVQTVDLNSPEPYQCNTDETKMTAAVRPASLSALNTLAIQTTVQGTLERPHAKTQTSTLAATERPHARPQTPTPASTTTPVPTQTVHVNGVETVVIESSDESEGESHPTTVPSRPIALTKRPPDPPQRPSESPTMLHFAHFTKQRRQLQRLHRQVSVGGGVIDVDADSSEDASAQTMKPIDFACYGNTASQVLQARSTDMDTSPCSALEDADGKSREDRRVTSALVPEELEIQNRLAAWDGQLFHSEESKWKVKKGEELAVCAKTEDSPLFSLGEPLDSTDFTNEEKPVLQRLYSVKAEFRSRLHRLAIPHGIRFDELTSRLRETFEAEDFSIQYRDNESDFVSLSSDRDMEELFVVAQDHSLHPLRIRLISSNQESSLS